MAAAKSGGAGRALHRAAGVHITFQPHGRRQQPLPASDVHISVGPHGMNPHLGLRALRCGGSSWRQQAALVPAPAAACLKTPQPALQQPAPVLWRVVLPSSSCLQGLCGASGPALLALRRHTNATCESSGRWEWGEGWGFTQVLSVGNRSVQQKSSQAAGKQAGRASPSVFIVLSWPAALSQLCPAGVEHLCARTTRGDPTVGRQGGSPGSLQVAWVMGRGGWL